MTAKKATVWRCRKSYSQAERLTRRLVLRDLIQFGVVLL